MSIIRQLAFLGGNYMLIGSLTGLLFGSFLNVCISRLPQHESIVHPRSHCPICQHPIRWYDNIPIISFLFLRGRCRDCGSTIALRYPLVELTVVAWFVLSGLRLVMTIRGLAAYAMERDIPPVLWASSAISVISFAILGFLLIGLIVMDWQTHLLPNAFTLTGIVIGLFLVCTQAIFLPPHQGDVVLGTTHQLRMSSPGSNAAHGNIFLTGTEALVFGRIAAIVGAAGLLLLVRWLYKLLRHREGLGLGDVKLIAMIAAFLGFWPAILALFIGVFTSAAYGLFLMARGRANALTKLPLGSFLSAGGLVAAIFGSKLIDMYAAMLH
jgi:leader peptidase (prepilin peptidase) / N-methyltransferase